MYTYNQKLILKDIDTVTQAELCCTIASLTQLNKKISTFLHFEELTYYNTILFARRKQNYLLGRYCVKQAISRYFKKQKLTDILIKPGIFEYPIVYLKDNKKIQVTISHAEPIGIALAFPETHIIGVDIEKIDNRTSLIYQDHSNEKFLLCNFKNDSIDIFYTLSWTLKEALSKALKIGMTASLEIYSIKSIVYYEDRWLSEFEYFGQYQGLSFILGTWVCSIVYPKCTQINFDLIDFKAWFFNLNF